MTKKKVKVKKRKIAVYLFKEEINDWKSALKEGIVLEEYTIKGYDRNVLCMYAKRSISNLPKWTDFFNEYLEQDIEGLYNASSSAVLFVKQNKRIFAFTFGYGWNFLNLGYAEDTFGLKIALNSIDTDKIRSVNVKNLDTVVRQSNIQTSQVGSVDNFGLNIDKDILNAVTGISNDTSLGNQISGSISLHLSLSIKIDALPGLCSKLLGCFTEMKYKEKFPWVDHITDIKNKLLINELNLLLIEAIHERASEGLFWAVPELIDWESIQGFKYKLSDEELKEDIHIDDVLPQNIEELKSKVNIDWLKKKVVYCIGSENDELVNKWPMYSCINYEVRKQESTYLLTAGKWFKIDTDYVSSVDDEIKGISEYNNYKLPEFDGKHEKEFDYNKRVFDTDNSRCCLMDTKMIPYGGGHSKVEFCDLYIDKKDFVHVKRFRGSACLSHLFFQGFNSAFLLLAENAFVKAVNKELPSTWRFDDRKTIQANKYQVVFAVISKVKKNVKGIFPFFSRVSLLQVYKQLRAYGYKVSIAKINIKKQGK